MSKSLSTKSNVVPFRRKGQPQPQKQPDSWCVALKLKDGRTISGGAAREARLKAVGGVEALLRKVLDEATAGAINASKKRG